MFALEGATWSTTSMILRMGADLQTKSGEAPSPRSRRFSSSNRRLLRSARQAEAAVFNCWTTRTLSQGFCTKSHAPHLIALIARSIVPHAVMTMTGRSGSALRISVTRSSPSRPAVVLRA